MAHYFFDATADDLLVTDYHGREIEAKSEVRSAMVEAVHDIRTFLGDELASKAWNLEVRLGTDNRVATVRFEDVEAFEQTPDAVPMAA